MTAYTINIKGRLMDLAEPKVMGVINVTPDSFYASSRARTESEIAQRAATMIADGADIIDIGAFSTRPDASCVSEEDEKERLRMALSVVRREFPDAVVSVDTFRPAVMQMAYDEFGADIINDVSGGNPHGAFGGTADSSCDDAPDDDETSVPPMFSLAAKIGIPYILMSSKPTLESILIDFARRTRQLRSLGVKDIILDPGFGFGKTLVQNYQLLNTLDRIGVFGLPVMAALSRKSMLCNLVGTDADGALNATTAANAVALMRGASILRVHDVRECVQTIKIVTQTLRSSHPEQSV